MSIPKTQTLDHIVERNRTNALSSTGPRSPAGKSVSRQNALKHGLCANPAAGVVEDSDEFEQMHDALVERFQPHDLVEAGLVQRIAVSLWRLQRATRIDAAVSTMSARRESPLRQQVQDWMDRITTQFWNLDYVDVKDPELLRVAILNGQAEKGRPYHRLERRFLRYADKMRDEEMMKDGPGIVAMVRLIERYVTVLENQWPFGPIDAQLLAWLLGESAQRLVPAHDAEDQRAVFYPDEKLFESRIDRLISDARKRSDGEALSDEFVGLVATRIAMLRGQSVVADDPYLLEHAVDKRTASLLPDAATLDRLIRYETHADRTLHRALETLARLRGATVKTLATTITKPGPGGITVEVRGQLTQWRPTRAPES